MIATGAALSGGATSGDASTFRGGPEAQARLRDGAGLILETRARRRRTARVGTTIHSSTAAAAPASGIEPAEVEGPPRSGSSVWAGASPTSPALVTMAAITVWHVRS